MKNTIKWFAVIVAAALLLAFNSHAAPTPLGCSAYGIGIFLNHLEKTANVGDTLHYSVTVFNGDGNPRFCDLVGISANITTPDGVVHNLTLVRTALSSGQWDYYPDVVSYVVRAQDIKPDGTAKASALDTDSLGNYSRQGVNTEVCLLPGDCSDVVKALTAQVASLQTSLNAANSKLRAHGIR